MSHYTQGKPTRQGHKGIPEGYFEEEQGLKGFFGPVSHLIRKKPSTHWSNIDGPLKPRLFDLIKVTEPDVRQRLLHNQHLSISWWNISASKPTNDEAFRNADGDTMYFCHFGEGDVFTDFGVLHYEKGQYVVVPKCLTHLIVPKADSAFLVIENKSSHYEPPERGIVGRHAIYDPNAVGKPDLELQSKKMKDLNLEVTKVRVKHNGINTFFTYDSEIFDVIGWKGDLYPYTLHTDHMMPLMSHRAHLPPSAHTTFVAKEFVVCTFLPRPLEQDDDALKVPFYHQNIDYDEVLFYHDGDFFSRDNLHAGMMSFHPAGFAHGPHPNAVKNIKNKTKTDEYAVMIDSRWPLQRDEKLIQMEVKDYWKSWQKK